MAGKVVLRVDAEPRTASGPNLCGVCVCMHVHVIGLINEQCSSLYFAFVNGSVCVCVCGHACVYVRCSTNHTHILREEMTGRSQLCL